MPFYGEKGDVRIRYQEAGRLRLSAVLRSGRWPELPDQQLADRRVQLIRDFQ